VKGQRIDLGCECPFTRYQLRYGLRDSLAPRKEVIQPQVLLQLPCYDFTPIAGHTMDGFLPEGLEHRLPVQPTFVM
jgi:hypothetical protein